MNNQTNNQELDSLRSELVSELSTASPSTETPTTESAEKKVPGDGSTPKPDKVEPKTDDKAKDTTKAADAAKTGEVAQTDDKGEKKPELEETDYSKARKEKDRFRVNWTELEKGKTELKAAQAELDRQRQTIAQETQRLEQERLKAASSVRKTSKYTPEQLEKYAGEFEAEGKPELAAAARAKANELREAAGVEQQQQTRQQQENVKKAIHDHWTKAQADFPDAAKADSPLRLKANAMYKEVADDLVKNGMRPAPILHYLAVKHADALLKAETATAENEGLKKKVTELETENKRLTKSTALPGASPAANVPAGKDITSEPLHKQRDSLRGALAQ